MEDPRRSTIACRICKGPAWSTRLGHGTAELRFVVRRSACRSTGEAPYLAEPDRRAILIDPYATTGMFSALPPGGFDQGTYDVLPAPATRLIDDGDVLDLGDRHLEVLHTPGHSPGSIALWEAASGVLFSGDTVYDGPLVTDAWHSAIDDYVLSMERLLALPVRVVHGGHFPSFGGARYRALIQAFMDAHRA